MYKASLTCLLMSSNNTTQRLLDKIKCPGGRKFKYIPGRRYAGCINAKGKAALNMLDWLKKNPQKSKEYYTLGVGDSTNDNVNPTTSQQAVSFMQEVNELKRVVDGLRQKVKQKDLTIEGLRSHIDDLERPKMLNDILYENIYNPPLTALPLVNGNKTPSLGARSSASSRNTRRQSNNRTLSTGRGGSGLTAAQNPALNQVLNQILHGKNLSTITSLPLANGNKTQASAKRSSASSRNSRRQNNDRTLSTGRSRSRPDQPPSPQQMIKGGSRNKTPVSGFGPSTSSKKTKIAVSQQMKSTKTQRAAGLTQPVQRLKRKRKVPARLLNYNITTN